MYTHLYLLPKEMGDELIDDIERLMRMWSPCDNASDYLCAFCGERAVTNDGEVPHKDNCSGVAYLKALKLERLRTQHESEKPVTYRGYKIVPAFYTQPYYVRGEKHHTGYTLTDAKLGTNMAPGATAFFTIEHAKAAADCIIEAGGHGRPWDSTWTDKYHALLRARIGES